MHFSLAALKCKQTRQKFNNLESHYIDNSMHKSLKHKDRAYTAVIFHNSAICIPTKSPSNAGTLIAVNVFKIKSMHVQGRQNLAIIKLTTFWMPSYR